MIELANYARDGRLGALIAETSWLQAYNGVEGIALSYDPRLVGEAARRLAATLPGAWTDTLEFSSLVAMLVAGVAESYERGGSRAEVEVDPIANLSSWWRLTTARDPKGLESPIVVEVTIGPEFGRERPFSGELMRDFGPYRLQLRKSPGARAQAGASGGRIVPNRVAGGAPIWGTLGGFLQDVVQGEVYATTAAHVCEGRDSTIFPTLFPRRGRVVRNLARRLVAGAGRLAPARYRPSTCRHITESPPQIVAPYQCSARATPAAAGLDVALQQMDARPRTRLDPVGLAGLGQVSQALPLSFVGATSGYQDVAITSYSVWHSYQLSNGSFACVHDCLQIRLRDRPYVRTDLSAGGDSGAWIMARGLNEPFWVGMLTGGDGDRAGIVPAERISAHFETALNCVLVPAV